MPSCRPTADRLAVSNRMLALAKRSGITSDPNRPDDPEYIVRLVGQVVRVSVETVKIVNSLPESYGGPPPTAL